mmetsp:Transcript_17081/g.53486  ORF Transcript_17081/g.53486 Transcript_17081/m.53486 type:complete len:239 (+) Transcript_17081:651-1367(+)
MVEHLLRVLDAEAGDPVVRADDGQPAHALGLLEQALAQGAARGLKTDEAHVALLRQAPAQLQRQEAGDGGPEGVAGDEDPVALRLAPWCQGLLQHALVVQQPLRVLRDVEPSARHEEVPFLVEGPLRGAAPQAQRVEVFGRDAYVVDDVLHVRCAAHSDDQLLVLVVDQHGHRQCLARAVVRPGGPEQLRLPGAAAPGALHHLAVEEVLVHAADPVALRLAGRTAAAAAEGQAAAAAP